MNEVTNKKEKTKLMVKCDKVMLKLNITILALNYAIKGILIPHPSRLQEKKK